MGIFGIDANSNNKKPVSQKNIHVVKAKETLYSISKKYGVSVEELRKYNGIGKDNAIDAGQTIKIPPKSAPNSTSVMPQKTPAKDEGFSYIPKDEEYDEFPVEEYKQSPLEIATRLKKLANHIAAVGDDDFTETLMQINKDNVIEVIESYNKISPKESLIEMICDEWGSSEKDRKAAVNHVMDTLCEKVGETIATDEVRGSFTQELNDEFDSWGWVSTKKMDKIMNSMIADYAVLEAKQIQAAKDKRTVRIGRKKTTSGRLRLDADSVAVRENRPKGRPDPVLDKNGNIVANVKVHNPIGHGSLDGRTIIVNAGHGGYNPNNGFFDAGSAKCDKDGDMVEEWSTNDAIAKKLIPLLTMNGAKVIYMNGSAINIMDAKKEHDADLFLSIHCNSAEKPERNGQVIIYRDNNKDNSRLAQTIEKHLENSQEIDAENCNTKLDDRDLGVLKAESSIPSVLIEAGFLTNEDDIEKLQDANFQSDMAKNIANGLSEYFKTAPKKAEQKKATPSGKEKNKLTLAATVHTVKKGETLYSIEKKYGMRAGELAYLNNINANSLKVGQKIKIPERYNVGKPANKNDVAKLLGFSPKFIDDLMTFEGKKDVHRIFSDKVGNATIGYGHLLDTAFEKKYYKNRKLSDIEVYTLLAKDLIEAENIVRISIGSENYEKLSQNQKQAVVDFVFSRGGGTFNSEVCDELREGLIEGDNDKAATNLTYNRSIKTGQVMNGLTKRRLYEMAMFAGDNKSDEVLDAARDLFEEGLRSAKKEKLNDGTIAAFKRDVQNWFDGQI